MVEKTSYKPYRQITAFNRLEALNLISNLLFRKGVRGAYYWTFDLSEITFEYDNKEVDLDFCKYTIEVRYTEKSPPKVFITKPKLVSVLKHIYTNGSICLYKPSNWQWLDNMAFDKDLFPKICTWIYFYEVWVETGNWIGEEAVHDLRQEVIDRIMYRNVESRN